MYDQINDFMSERFSPLLSGFRKGYSSQHALLHMLDHWHSKLDSGQYVAAVVMDLSKAFDCINHSLLLAKMHAYGFSIEALNLVRSYLTNRKQRVVLSEAKSPWESFSVGKHDFLKTFFNEMLRNPN